MAMFSTSYYVWASLGYLLLLSFVGGQYVPLEKIRPRVHAHFLHIMITTITTVTVCCGCHDYYRWLQLLHFGSGAPISRVHGGATLLLSIMGKQKARVWSGLQWHNVHTKFHENQQIRSVHPFIKPRSSWKSNTLQDVTIQTALWFKSKMSLLRGTVKPTFFLRAQNLITL